MSCIVCHTEKLSDEFPPYNPSEECEHPCLTCLRCLVKNVTQNGKCPHPGCGIEVSKTSETIYLFKEILTDMFKEYETEYTPLVDTTDGKSFINITGLTGSSIKIAYHKESTVRDLKLKIKEKLNHNPNKQKLLYRDKEMKMFNDSKRLCTLADYGVEPNTTICLVVCLYCIPDNFDHVVFDLNWGYPVGGMDYLDASCLIFSDTTLVSVVDYCSVRIPAVKHSGDEMDAIARRGHHKIDVYIQKIPQNVTHMFFTLSAWSSPNISKYPNPSLRFYEASDPTKDLCSTTFTHACDSQAVVMCSLSFRDGSWQIFDSGKLSDGNAMNYNPLTATIQQLIKAGY